MDSILKYATVEEINDVAGFRVKWQAEIARGKSLQQDQWRLAGQIRDRSKPQTQESIAAAQRYVAVGRIGNAEAAPALVGRDMTPSTTVDDSLINPNGNEAVHHTLAELKQIEIGLKKLMEDSLSEAENYKAAFQNSGFKLLRECVERAAEVYRTQADALVNSWLDLSSADGLLRTRDHTLRLWPDAAERKLHIPKNSTLRAFSGGEPYIERQVYSEGAGMGDKLQRHMTALQSEATGVFGAWPLE